MAKIFSNGSVHLHIPSIITVYGTQTQKVNWDKIIKGVPPQKHKVLGICLVGYRKVSTELISTIITQNIKYPNFLSIVIPYQTDDEIYWVSNTHKKWDATNKHLEQILNFWGFNIEDLIYHPSKIDTNDLNLISLGEEYSGNCKYPECTKCGYLGVSKFRGSEACIDSVKNGMVFCEEHNPILNLMRK